MNAALFVRVSSVDERISPLKDEIKILSYGWLLGRIVSQTGFGPTFDINFRPNSGPKCDA